MIVDMKLIEDYTTIKHSGQSRIGGEAYITHPIGVKDMLVGKGIDDKNYLATALLHDVLEDTDATDEDILGLTNEDVLYAVKLLTKEKGYVMNSYMEDIKLNEIAHIVKLADRIHNLRSAVIASEKFRKRYIKETQDYYLELSKGTLFEREMEEALNNLIKII